MRQSGQPETFGPYLIHEVIGIGGMASVHRAEKPGEHATVALKRMLPQFAENDEAVKAFIREAQLAGMMNHPNVAETYESGRIDDTYFIAMELIVGRPLGDLIRCAGTRGGPMPLDVSLNLVGQICEALDYAHTLTDRSGEPLGIIHRDVSPSNVVVTDAGCAKLIDFGVAKGTSLSMQTQGITMKGKFGYMAPEYLFGKIDSRADIFAIGIIAHELLTGVSLFTCDDDLETMTRLRDMPIAPPSHSNGMVPPEIDEVVMKALLRDPDQRWQQAHEMRVALAGATRKLGIRSTTGTVVEWLAVAFGETLTFGDGDDELTLAPVTQAGAILPGIPLTQPQSPSTFEKDDWSRDTSIRGIIGADLDDVGAQPVSLDEPAKIAPAAKPEPETKPLPPPSVIVIAPQRTRTKLMIIFVVLAAIAVVALMMLRR